MFGGAWAELSARRTLAHLQERIGIPGLAAAAGVPGLVAVIDQHAAAVRDILSYGVDLEGPATAAGVVLLAGYARGLVDQARELGWRFGAPSLSEGWATADWVTTRLLAICDLAGRTEQPEPSS
jgi:Family of unknown function (DUF6401)